MTKPSIFNEDLCNDFGVVAVLPTFYSDAREFRRKGHDHRWLLLVCFGGSRVGTWKITCHQIRFGFVARVERYLLGVFILFVLVSS